MPIVVVMGSPSVGQWDFVLSVVPLQAVPAAVEGWKPVYAR